MSTRNIYDAFAALLMYPGADHQQRLRNTLSLAQGRVGEVLTRFAEQVRGLSTQQMQELFTQTFDLNPVCSLELGWHLFGENYDRGIMLVKMREQLRVHGVTENGELPDHLTHALALLARMDANSAEDFAGACVLPALEKMLGAMKDKGNAYENVLLAIKGQLHSDFPEIPLSAPVAQLTVLPQGVVS
ncbi:MAG: nitrate reductase molybdenum cofactor assembly chaperone [Terriglobales bacterium]